MIVKENVKKSLQHESKCIEKQRLAFVREASVEFINGLFDRALELFICDLDLLELYEGLLLELLRGGGRLGK